MSNLLLSKIFPGNNTSVNSSCTHPTPPPLPGLLCGIYPPCQSRGAGVGHLQILLCPGAGHLPTPGLFPSFLTRMQFPIRLTTQRILLEKQAHWLICQGPEKLKRVFKACSRFHACFFPLHIKSESHGEIGSYQDVNQRFLDKLKLNQISVDII